MSSAVEFKNLNKSYGPVQACKNISFEIQHGQIHALVGENGAGKSTLMNLLGGLTKADSGEMLINGNAYQPQSAKDAFTNKVGFIHQHFLLAENLTVLEHLILNWPAQNILSPFSNSALLKKVNYFFQNFNWTLNLNYKISQLSVGEQQRIEIIKALLSDPEIIIFDEPTAVLTPQEIIDFLKFLKFLKSQGRTLILISHKLAEVQEVADTLTILRHGESILSSDVSKISLDEIAENMIGQKLKLSADSSSAMSSKKPLTEKLTNGLSLFHSEILGVAGIEGHGQSELINEVLKEINDKKISCADIPEDRLKYGIFNEMSLVDHMVLRHPTLSKNGFIQKNKAVKATQNLIHEWDVRPNNPHLFANQLSGGNQQKFVIGRELYHNPDFILAAHPTRGVDLGAQQMIHTAFFKQRELGKSILLISSDLDEVLKLSDRFVILFKNKIFGPFQKSQLSEIEIGQIMTGTFANQANYLLGKLT